MKQPVSNGIQKQISSAGIWIQSYSHKQSIQSLDHTAGCHDTKNRLKYSGNRVNGLVKQTSLGTLFRF